MIWRKYGNENNIMTREERKEYARKYYEKNREILQAKGNQYHQDNKEKRKKYYQKYYEDNKAKIDTLVKKWKEENVGYDKKYYEEHREELKIKSKEYKIENKEEVSKRQKEYLSGVDVKKKRSEYGKNYIKKRRKEDPLFNLTITIRTLIHSSFSNNGYSKESRTQDILGCSFIELKEHLESKFTEGMSWENKGKWHIDHIKPTSLAKTEEEIYELNRYTNLQPLWAIDNIRKGNKY